MRSEIAVELNPEMEAFGYALGVRRKLTSNVVETPRSAWGPVAGRQRKQHDGRG